MVRLPIHLRALLVVAMVGAATTCGNAQDIQTRIENYLAVKVEQLRIPGLTAAVVRDGKVIYSGAHGVPRLGQPEKLSPRHVFHFASVSKPWFLDEQARHRTVFHAGDTQVSAVTFCCCPTIELASCWSATGTELPEKLS